MWVTLACVPENLARPVGVIKQKSAVLRSVFHMFMVCQHTAQSCAGTSEWEVLSCGKGSEFYRGELQS